MHSLSTLRKRALRLAAALPLAALLGCQAAANAPSTAAIGQSGSAGSEASAQNVAAQNASAASEASAQIAGAGWWVTTDGKRLHSTDGTTLDTGFLEQPEGWYYLSPEDGSVTYGLFQADDAYYFADLDTGLVLSDEWVPVEEGKGGTAGYAGPNGIVVPFDEVTINEDGRLVFKEGGWHQVGNRWYYATEDGIEYRGWKVDEDGTRYWLDTQTGVMATGLVTIDGEAYIFNDDGSLRYISNDERLDRIVCGLVRDVCGDDLRTAYDYVAHGFKYDKRDVAPDYKDWEEDYAIKLYDEGEGNCYSFSCLFCFLARAMGYDCKTIDGLVWIRWDETRTLYSHSWVEMYGIGDETLVCDPVLENGTTDIPSYLITYEDNANATGKYVYEV